MKVLIVDDHPVNRKLLRASLESEGAAVLEASDGAEALRLLEEQPAEAIISDILMPNMDGLQLCLEVRRNPKIASLPFIIYTSTYDSAADRELAASVGADHYIVKPAPVSRIIEALQASHVRNGAPRQVPQPVDDPVTVSKQYSEALVHKLEQKNEELRRANAKISELNQTLELRVKTRTEELAQANSELSHRTHEIQSFYHTLSHELRTPLTAAREFVCLVLDGLGGPVNESQSEYLSLAREGCDQMKRCLDDLLDAARLDTGKLSLEIQPGALSVVASKVLKTLNGSASAKGIRLETHFQPELPSLPMDEFRIAQVLTNLIKNALKFTPSGGTVAVRLEADPVRPAFQRISVRDTGCGIPRDQWDLIFERMYQVKAGEQSCNQGMGLGLYLCRELVMLHGGEITVSSEPGRGSLFTVLLPENHSIERQELLASMETGFTPRAEAKFADL